MTAWGDKLPFNTVCADLSVGGWVKAVSFSPDGENVAWAGHDSTLSIYNSNTKLTQTLKTQFLPFSTLIWISETTIITAGYDCEPILFTKSSSDQW